MTVLPRAVPAAAFSLFPILLASGARAQGELVLEYGVPNPLLGGAVATHAVGHGITDTGEWWARVAAGNRAELIVNGELPLAQGDVLPDGSTFVVGSSVHFSGRGDTLIEAWILEPGASNNTDALLWNGAPLVKRGADVLGPTGAVVGTIGQFEDVLLDGNDRVIAQAVLEPFTLGAPSVLVEIPVGAGLQQARLLLGYGVHHPDGAECLDVERIAMNRRGQLLVANVERASALAPAARTIRVDGAVRLRDGDPGPVAGSTWSFPWSFGGIFLDATCSLAEDGDVVLVAHLTGAVEGEALACGNTLVALRGQPLPGGGPELVTQIYAECIVGLGAGRVHWRGFVGGQSRFFLGDETIYEPGTPVAGSALERVIRYSSQEVDAVSPNGGFSLDHVNLVDGRRGLLRLARSVGEPGCAQTMPHSGGTTAALEALGSDVAGGHELRLHASGLPTHTFGLFAVSRSAGASTPMGTQGVLCLSGSVGRFLTVLDSGAAGRFELAVDTNDLPIGSGIAVQAGDTWHFQGWFRDANPTPTSNFTDSVTVSFH